MKKKSYKKSYLVKIISFLACFALDNSSAMRRTPEVLNEKGLRDSFVLSNSVQNYSAIQSNKNRQGGFGLSNFGNGENNYNKSSQVNQSYIQPQNQSHVQQNHYNVPYNGNLVNSRIVYQQGPSSDIEKIRNGVRRIYNNMKNEWDKHYIQLNLDAMNISFLFNELQTELQLADSNTEKSDTIKIEATQQKLKSVFDEFIGHLKISIASAIDEGPLGHRDYDFLALIEDFTSSYKIVLTSNEMGYIQHNGFHGSIYLNDVREDFVRKAFELYSVLNNELNVMLGDEDTYSDGKSENINQVTKLFHTYCLDHEEKSKNLLKYVISMKDAFISLSQLKVGSFGNIFFTLVKHLRSLYKNKLSLRAMYMQIYGRQQDVSFFDKPSEIAYEIGNIVQSVKHAEKAGLNSEDDNRVDGVINLFLSGENGESFSKEAGHFNAEIVRLKQKLEEKDRLINNISGHAKEQRAYFEIEIENRRQELLRQAEEQERSARLLKILEQELKEKKSNFIENLTGEDKNNNADNSALIEEMKQMQEAIKDLKEDIDFFESVNCHSSGLLENNKRFRDHMNTFNKRSFESVTELEELVQYSNNFIVQFAEYIDILNQFIAIADEKQLKKLPENFIENMDTSGLYEFISLLLSKLKTSLENRGVDVDVVESNNSKIIQEKDSYKEELNELNALLEYKNVSLKEKEIDYEGLKDKLENEIHDKERIEIREFYYAKSSRDCEQALDLANSLLNVIFGGDGIDVNAFPAACNGVVVNIDNAVIDIVQKKQALEKENAKLSTVGEGQKEFGEAKKQQRRNKELINDYSNSADHLGEIKSKVNTFSSFLQRIVDYALGVRDAISVLEKKNEENIGKFSQFENNLQGLIKQNEEVRGLLAESEQQLRRAEEEKERIQRQLQEIQLKADEDSNSKEMIKDLQSQLQRKDEELQGFIKGHEMIASEYDSVGSAISRACSYLCEDSGDCKDYSKFFDTAKRGIVQKNNDLILQNESIDDEIEKINLVIVELKKNSEESSEKIKENELEVKSKLAEKELNTRLIKELKNLEDLHERSLKLVRYIRDNSDELGKAYEKVKKVADAMQRSEKRHRDALLNVLDFKKDLAGIMSNLSGSFIATSKIENALFQKYIEQSNHFAKVKGLSDIFYALFNIFDSCSVVSNLINLNLVKSHVVGNEGEVHTRVLKSYKEIEEDMDMLPGLKAFFPVVQKKQRKVAKLEGWSEVVVENEKKRVMDWLDRTGKLSETIVEKKYVDLAKKASELIESFLKSSNGTYNEQSYSKFTKDMEVIRSEYYGMLLNSSEKLDFKYDYSALSSVEQQSYINGFYGRSHFNEVYKILMNKIALNIKPTEDEQEYIGYVKRVIGEKYDFSYLSKLMNELKMHDFGFSESISFFFKDDDKSGASIGSEFLKSANGLMKRIIMDVYSIDSRIFQEYKSDVDATLIGMMQLQIKAEEPQIQRSQVVGEGNESQVHEKQQQLEQLDEQDSELEQDERDLQNSDIQAYDAAIDNTSVKVREIHHSIKFLKGLGGSLSQEVENQASEIKRLLGNGSLLNLHADDKKPQNEDAFQINDRQDQIPSNEFGRNIPLVEDQNELIKKIEDLQLEIGRKNSEIARLNEFVGKQELLDKSQIEDSSDNIIQDLEGVQQESIVIGKQNKLIKDQRLEMLGYLENIKNLKKEIENKEMAIRDMQKSAENKNPHFEAPVVKRSSSDEGFQRNASSFDESQFQKINQKLQADLDNANKENHSLSKAQEVLKQEKEAMKESLENEKKLAENALKKTREANAAKEEMKNQLDAANQEKEVLIQGKNKLDELIKKISIQFNEYQSNDKEIDELQEKTNHNIELISKGIYGINARLKELESEKKKKQIQFEEEKRNIAEQTRQEMEEQMQKELEEAKQKMRQEMEEQMRIKFDEEKQKMQIKFEEEKRNIAEQTRQEMEKRMQKKLEEIKEQMKVQSKKEEIPSNDEENLNCEGILKEMEENSKSLTGDQQ